MAKQISQSRVALALWLACLTGASGEELFTSQLLFDNSVASQNRANSITDWWDAFTENSLQGMYSGYTPTSRVEAAANLRGLRVLLLYDSAATNLRLSIPVLGIEVQFDGMDREESRKLLKDWLRGRVAPEVTATRHSQTVSAQEAIEAVLHGTVKYSPVEPLAGNPNSLQTRMTVADYARATDVGGYSLGGNAVSNPENLFRFDVGYFGGSAGNYNIQGIEAEIGGVINLANPHWAILLDSPLTFTWTEDTAKTLMVSFGLGAQYRVCDRWSLTAFGRGGAVGSIEVGSLGFLYSFDLTSYLRQPLGRTQLGWGLMAGFNDSVDGISIDGYEVSYNVTCYPLRTGLDWSVPLGFKLGQSPVEAQAFAIYTHFFGDEMYLQEQGELGLALRLMKDRDQVSWQGSRLFAAYVFGENYTGFNTGMGFNF